MSSTNTPYDDAFKTMLNYCRSSVIPLVNEMFKRDYKGDEKLVFLNQENVTYKNGRTEKRMTDAFFAIIGDDAVKSYFLLECQSTKGKDILLRAFNYEVKAASSTAELNGNVLDVVLPRVGIMFLRSNTNTPQMMTVNMHFGDKVFSIDVPVLKADAYDEDEILAKSLFFLIPFHIFRYEKQLKECDINGKKLDELKERYAKLFAKVQERGEQASIPQSELKTMYEMAEAVMKAVAKKYANVREGLGSVMGGKVIEMPWMTKYLDDVYEGEKRGKKQGIVQGLATSVRNLMSELDITLEKAMDLLRIPQSEREDVMKAVGAV